MNTIYVIGAANSDDPWVLNLEGYPAEGDARRAIRWQHQPNQAFDTGYWRTADLREGNLVDSETGAVYTPSRRPYTEAAWAEFIERTNLNT
jgi:hypothetical protein